VQLASRFVPVQTTIFWLTAAKAACFALILGGFAERAILNGWQRIAQQVCAVAQSL
jgi:hypothetical protein